jgi:hypothetical protein
MKIQLLYYIFMLQVKNWCWKYRQIFLKRWKSISKLLAKMFKESCFKIKCPFTMCIRPNVGYNGHMLMLAKFVVYHFHISPIPNLKSIPSGNQHLFKLSFSLLGCGFVDTFLVAIAWLFHLMLNTLLFKGLRISN